MKNFKIPLISLAVVFLIGLGFEFGTNAYIQLTIIYVIINMIMGMSLNLINGFTGQFSMGHAGFMAVGAYFSAWLSSHITLLSGQFAILNFFVYTFAAGLLAAFAGYLVGLPSLRLKGDYLAIVTLGFSEIIRVALLNLDFLGGARGISGIAEINEIHIGSFVLSRFILNYFFAGIWAWFCYLTIHRLILSTHGRTFLAVREDEIAAEAMGVNTTQAKVRSFVISSFFAGVAGSIFAHFTNYINPSIFSFTMSVNAIIIVVLGGMGSLTGSLIAATLITLLPELLRPVQEITGVDLRMVIYSLALILLMILRPKGLFSRGAKRV